MQPRSVPRDERSELSKDDELLDRGQHLTTDDSSEEYDGPDIRMEEFRCGFPNPLPKKPRTVEFNLDQRNPVWARCIPKARAICHEVGLNIQVINVLMLVRGPEDAQRTSTLHICVHDESIQPSWKPTLIRIFHMLRAERALDLHVLIRCNQIPERYIFPIEFDNPLVTLWPEKLLGPVISIIESYRLDFGAIEVFRFGTTRQDASPTILITIKDEDENDKEKELTWQKARLDIKKHCQSEGAVLPVVLRGSLASRTWPNSDSANMVTGRSSRSYNQLVPMGHSIGVEPKGAGTLGGYLQLKDRSTGTVKLVGLTTYQAVRGSDKNWPVNIDKNFTTWPLKEGHSRVQSPSKEDHHHEIRELSEQKAYLEEMWSYKKFKELRTLTSREEMHINSIKDTEERLQFCQNLNENDLNFGKVLASSGFRTSKRGNHCLDWALVEIDNGRVGENQFPDVENDRELGHMLPGLNESHVTQIFKGPFDKRICFFKTGRTSGLTCGGFSHIKSYVRTELPVNSQNETPRQRNTLEYVFVSSYRAWGSRKMETFSQEGDAGAWLLDPFGALAGLIWGTSGAGSCYVTPIRELMTDIGKHMKGVQVSLPNWEPEPTFNFSTNFVPWFVDEPYTLPAWVSPAELEWERL